ncbi:TRAP transporter small permease [Pannonibacter sp. Pt2]|uniref:TRAP transporter small permease protein n=1 Tax=Pannonibacter anstelovis TaxID=3121537 RepID=A0ABU7ZM75_9HYPH
MHSIIRLIWRSIDLIMAALLTAMIAIVFANVVLRYGFSSGIRVSVELSRLWFVWVVMLGAAVTLRRGEHLALAEFAEAAFPKYTGLLRRACWLVILGTVLLLFWGSMKQTIMNMANISPLTGLPSGLFYLSGVVSSVLMAAIAVVRIINPDSVKQVLAEDGAE